MVMCISVVVERLQWNPQRVEAGSAPDGVTASLWTWTTKGRGLNLRKLPSLSVCQPLWAASSVLTLVCTEVGNVILSVELLFGIDGNMLLVINASGGLSLDRSSGFPVNEILALISCFINNLIEDGMTRRDV